MIAPQKARPKAGPIAELTRVAITARYTLPHLMLIRPPRKTRLGVVALLGLAIALTVSACGSGERRPHIVIMMIDTLRAYRLGVLGHTNLTSLNIDALASEGIDIGSAGWSSVA